MNNGLGTSGPRGSGHDPRVVMPGTEARQGVTGHNVRYVLIVSTVCAVVAMTIAYYFVMS
jgi:hypothetical protein